MKQFVRRLVMMLLICTCVFCSSAFTARAAEYETITSVDLDFWLDSNGAIRVDTWEDYLEVYSYGNKYIKESWQDLKLVIEADRPYRLSLTSSCDFNFFREDGIIVSYQSIKRRTSRKVELTVKYFIHDGSCYHETTCFEDYDGYCDYKNYIYNETENTISYYDEHGNRHIIASYNEFCRPSSHVSDTDGGWWYYDNGEWYYYIGNERFKSGWRQIDGYWYHFESDGRMTVGWVDYTYCCNFKKDTDIPYGAMLTGWQQCSVFSGTYWYYFKPISGEKVTGRACIDGKWYQFDEQGKLLY